MKKKHFHLLCIVGVFFFSSFSMVFGQINNLVKTPPMGWNSWNVFHENINETQIKAIADAMETSGMREAGYIYLNLDDNWMATSRDANGNLQADPTRFPSGMKSLGDYIHSKGLKFGIYGDRGLLTCHHYNNNIQSQSGSYGNEEKDAAMFASWGIDYLKYDNCAPASGSNQQQDYERMRDALLNSGRDIVYSICAWGYQSWMPATGNLWRTTGDISNQWEVGTDGFFHGVIDIVDLNEPYAPNAFPGGWNDPDMLQIGNGVLTYNESRSHMSLWAMMAAPLFAGNDIRTMNAETKEILLNSEVIAVNQDSAGIQGTRVSAANGLEVWVKPLGSKLSTTKAIALLNRTANTADITVHFSDVELSGEIFVRDLWAHEDKGAFSESFTMSIPSHGTGLLKLSLQTVPQAPYKDIATIPGTIEAENYDVGGLGVSYYDTDLSNSGNVYRTDGVDITGDSLDGYKIGWTIAEEWLEYTVKVDSANIYQWEARVSSGNDVSSFYVLLDDTDITGTISVPNTGDWDTYTTVTGTTPALTTGNHIMRIVVSGAYCNIDWISFSDGTASLKPELADQWLHNSGTYQVYNPLGVFLGTVNLSTGESIGKQVGRLTSQSGTFLVKAKNGSKSYLINVHK